MKETKRVAIQGIAGANHEIAAREFFNDYDVEVVPCLTFQDLFDAVKADSQLYGIVAIENTLVGTIQSNYTLLKESGLTVIGEYKLRIKHNLMALPGVKIEELTEVHSHPMALRQCEAFFRKYPHIRLVESDDTALSAKEVNDKQTRTIGAIAPKLAAELYGLKILEHGIETNKKNFTRFLVVSQHGKTEIDELFAQNRINRSSIVFSLPQAQEVGSLSKVLTVFAFYGINLTKIQSNPIVGREWEYLFYIDLSFNNYTRYIQAVDAVRPLCDKLTVLGEFELGRQSHKE
ncbi:MAG: prephenate dehydratase [Bacteroidales bacterium]|nr:prephenate dehydratase [Bacteroidales bacterium]MCR5696774.1 prephenate dehydratase [Marinilabiliaceae bacterium]